MNARVRRSALGIVAAVIAGVGGWVAWPLSASVLARNVTDGVTIEDRNGVTLRSTRAGDGSSVRWMSYDTIDPDLITAFVAVEDQRFWEHHGIDPRAVARALIGNVRAGHVVSGASTITMQLARLLHPASRGWGAKLSQTLWALRLEMHLSKQQILEQYLNRVQLGQGAVGVPAASTLYFSASASEVSIGQAATLAGIAHAPSRDNPQVSGVRARARRALALGRMRAMGVATREDVARAKTEALYAPSGRAPFLAPHFTTRVLSWTAASRETGGIGTIRTSVDAGLQYAIEGEVRHTVDALRDRGVAQAAAVVLDNETGEVLAWVGSPDFWASEDGQTDMVVSARQPGSALKPFLYGLALDRGFTAASVLADIPKTYTTPTGPYRPRDYDRRFRGPTRAREALASSYNVPAVELASRVGAASLLQTLHLAGFSSLDRDAEYYGLGLALGNGDVTLIELANGYRALANGGEWRSWSWRPGAGEPEAHRVVSAAASAIITDILSDPVARIPGFGVVTPFDFPFPVAVKTGTSRHFTDNWAVGTTRGFTVAVWAGNFNGHPMEGVSGVTGAGPLLHRAVMATARFVSPGALITPSEAGAVPVPVCRLSGLRATSQCAQFAEWFKPGTEPARVDDWEQAGRVVLPDEYAEWVQTGLRPTASGVTLSMLHEGTQPVLDSSPVARPPARRAVAVERGFRIVSPLDGDRYAIPPGIEARYATIPLRVGGETGVVVWRVDGVPYARDRWSLAAGDHVIEAVSGRGEVARVRIMVER